MDFDSKMDLDINVVNVNIDINFGQVPECARIGMQTKNLVL